MAMSAAAQLRSLAQLMGNVQPPARMPSGRVDVRPQTFSATLFAIALGRTRSPVQDLCKNRPLAKKL
jgi:hypothetical protein